MSRLPESNRGHRGSRAFTFNGKSYYSRALYQAELRRVTALTNLEWGVIKRIAHSDRSGEGLMDINIKKTHNQVYATHNNSCGELFSSPVKTWINL